MNQTYGLNVERTLDELQGKLQIEGHCSKSNSIQQHSFPKHVD